MSVEPAEFYEERFARVVVAGIIVCMVIAAICNLFATPGEQPKEQGQPSPAPARTLPPAEMVGGFFWDARLGARSPQTVEL